MSSTTALVVREAIQRPWSFYPSRRSRRGRNREDESPTRAGDARLFQYPESFTRHAAELLASDAESAAF